MNSDESDPNLVVYLISSLLLFLLLLPSFPWMSIKLFPLHNFSCSFYVWISMFLFDHDYWHTVLLRLLFCLLVFFSSSWSSSSSQADLKIRKKIRHQTHSLTCKSCHDDVWKKCSHPGCFHESSLHYFCVWNWIYTEYTLNRHQVHLLILPQHLLLFLSRITAGILYVIISPAWFELLFPFTWCPSSLHSSSSRSAWLIFMSRSSTQKRGKNKDLNHSENSLHSLEMKTFPTWNTYSHVN